jgi:hypothetical protein
MVAAVLSGPNWTPPPTIQIRYERFDYLENKNNRLLPNVDTYLLNYTDLYFRRTEDGGYRFLRKVLSVTRVVVLAKSTKRTVTITGVQSEIQTRTS